MKTRAILLTSLGLLVAVLTAALPATGQWVTRDHRWQPRGPWNWAVPRELPQLYREFNGIDFGHRDTPPNAGPGAGGAGATRGPGVHLQLPGRSP